MQQQTVKTCNHLDTCSGNHYDRNSDFWCDHLNDCWDDHYGEIEGQGEDSETKANGFDNLSHWQKKV